MTRSLLTLALFTLIGATSIASPHGCISRDCPVDTLDLTALAVGVYRASGQLSHGGWALPFEVVVNRISDGAAESLFKAASRTRKGEICDSSIYRGQGTIMWGACIYIIAATVAFNDNNDRRNIELDVQPYGQPTAPGFVCPLLKIDKQSGDYEKE